MIPKTEAQRSKEYRERKKAKNKTIPKTGAQRTKECRERQKAKKTKLKEDNVDHLQSTSTKTTAEYMKEYRRKKKLQNQITQLNTLLAENYSKEKKRKTCNVHYLSDTEKLGSHIEFQASQLSYQQREKEKTLNDMLKQKTGGLEALDCQSKLQVSNEHPEVLQRNSFQAPYEQHSDCAQPQAIYYHDTEIPSDGNCFFFSVIKIMNLALSPLQIRQQLLASPFINSCINPNRARSILESETEYVEVDCIEIFSRVYNLNVCVHNYYVNTNTGREEIQFLHFKINDSQMFLHLHLRNEHFTPLIETTAMKVKNDNEQFENISSEIFADEENDGDDNDSLDNVNDTAPCMDINDINITLPIYTNYHKHANGHLQFYNHFKSNTFGHSCNVCDRLWWKRDLKKSNDVHDSVLQMILPNYVCGNAVDICGTCKKSLDKGKIPLLAAYNGFSFPAIPPHLPKLNLIEQRLISPRIPFMQIRTLRHVHGQYGIYGQIINVPVEVNTMVNQLPRNIDDDHCFYVHIKKKLIHKTSYVRGLINKGHLKQWLLYLVKTPLYVHKNITINEALLKSNGVDTELTIDDISEHVTIEDNLIAQQQTLMWNESKMLHMVPGEKSIPHSILFHEYAEELSFPTIYGGQFRTYRDGCNVTSFIQAASELRRTDRRATDPQHLLFMAAKIMRQRVNNSVSDAFKHVGFDTKITKEDVQSEDYINSCIETNLAFLRCIPNSAWYWAERKKDLFAIIRQFGPPTAFMTLSANETGWPDLLKLLYKLKNNGAEIEDESLSEMSYVHKAQLVNEDAVTCAIYFNKLVICLLKILQSKNGNPFGKYRVKDYFKRIEFQHRGSPHAHILLWLDNAPEDLLNNCKSFTDMVDALVSVSESEASGNIKLQTHKHTFACYEKMDPNKKDNCRFGAPFLPSRNTITLMPMTDTDSDYSVEKFNEYKKHYALLKTNLENNNYDDFDHFYAENNIVSDKHYYDILRAGIVRPKLFYRRTPSEKWHNTFNPFVFHCLQSNMDIQIIQDEYACAAYVVEYVNKHNRGISNLQRLIIQTMDENPEFDIVDITKKLSIDVLHTVEMSAQEAAWYLLREPMAKSSVVTVYIPTIYPTERQRIRKTLKKLSNLDDDCTNIWKENWFDKYEKRPENLENVTLAQFVANYNKRTNGEYYERKTSTVIRYRNYDMAKHFNDYRREMVLLHIPFRSEDNDVLAENKFIQIYEDYKDLILERRKEFESNLNIEKTLEICRQLGRELNILGSNIHQIGNFIKMSEQNNTDRVTIKEESLLTSEYNYEIKVDVKTEKNSDDEVELKIGTEKLYADHIIKEEMVIGPEVVQRIACDSVSFKDAPLPKKLNLETQNVKTNQITNQNTTTEEMDTEEGITPNVDWNNCNLRTTTPSQDIDLTKSSDVFACDSCGKHFEYKCELVQHIECHEKTKRDIYWKCKECAYQTVTRETLERHKKLHDKNRHFVCDECGYRYRYSYSLKRHVNAVHSDNKIHKCDICSYVTYGLNQLNSHIKIHSGKKPLSCSVCGYECKCKSSFAKHLKIHSRVKPVACTVCNYKCRSYGTLTEHLRVHTGEKPFTCSVCKIKFSYKSSLAKHLRIHSGEKPYACSECDYKCTERSNFILHLRTHTGDKPFSCSVCQLKFSGKSGLARHIKIHSGEKAHACSECDYKSSERFNLTMHLRTHTDEKPFSCSLCKFKCRYKSGLTRHLKIHSGEKL